MRWDQSGRSWPVSCVSSVRELRLARLVMTAPDSVVIVDAAGLHGESWSSPTP
jgi:hypothetical protein